MDGWVTRLIERASRQELFRGESALHEACYSAAPLEAIRRIISLHPEAILIQDANGRIPLHWALSSKTQYAKARLLLQFLRHQAVHGNGNGNVNVNDHVNVHVHDTTSLNRHHIQKMLLARNELGYTALDHACSSGAPSDILEALITLCPQAATVKRMGRTPLHQLLDYVQSNELQIETPSMKILLHAHPHAVSDADRLGNIPLHLAVYEQTNVEAFMMLLEHSQSHGERERQIERQSESQSLSLPLSLSLNRNPNPNPNRKRNRNPNIVATKNRLGATPLHIAAMNNAPSHVIDAIIEASPSTVHAMDVDGNVPLHLAFIYRASVLLKSRLIYHGGERLLGVVNDRGQTPIQGTAYVEDVYDILRIMPHVACSCY